MPPPATGYAVADEALGLAVAGTGPPMTRSLNRSDSELEARAGRAPSEGGGDYEQQQGPGAGSGIATGIADPRHLESIGPREDGWSDPRPEVAACTSSRKLSSGRPFEKVTA